MATIRKIKKDGGLPDYYYVMPNQDRIDILVVRSENSGNTYSCVLPRLTVNDVQQNERNAGLF